MASTSIIVGRSLITIDRPLSYEANVTTLPEWVVNVIKFLDPVEKEAVLLREAKLLNWTVIRFDTLRYLSKRGAIRQWLESYDQTLDSCFIFYTTTNTLIFIQDATVALLFKLTWG